MRQLAAGLALAVVLLATGCSSCCHKSATISGAPPCCGAPGPLPPGAIPAGGVGLGNPPPPVAISNASPCPNCVRR